MNTSLNEFKEKVLEQLLALLWRQWSAIGVSGYSGSEELKVVDPEALLLLTLTVARYDARLFDEVLDWLVVNGDFLNVQRLQSLVKQFDFQARAELSAVAELLGQKASVALKWNKLATRYTQDKESPLFYMKDGRLMPAPKDCDKVFQRHGLLRPPVKMRNLSQPFPSEGLPTLLLRLRALLGVNLRCEILCLLGSVDEIHPSLIARRIGQHPRSTQNVLAEMVLSGVVQVRTRAREKIYSLTPGILDRLLRPEGFTPWQNSVPLFRALEILWLGVSDPRRQKLDPLMLASECRRLAKEMKGLFGDAGMGQPLREGSAFPGEKYFEIFQEDVKKVLERL
ncbi:hypothetical protein EDC39_107147 [Geothermobacter ehrlichii]|uniref:Uncharacterized protein n=1 Tax=Geothermobacter ehrlichii TaxID=213224 RepID=A0A5D3WHS8_9BACT|nr:hypothetical protein [Geothermobacter ehrlichii]TYO98346.1 hypothetical protein EDC39_107147 [Geothermobacter ehrlichii]